jgi:hypothetical protein
MDAFSNKIFDSINETNTNNRDKYEEINLKNIKLNDENRNEEENLAINLSNLNSEQLIEILNKNKKLLNDFFKFGLFSTLDQNVLAEVIKTFEISVTEFESVLEHLIQLKDDVKILFYLFRFCLLYF